MAAGEPWAAFPEHEQAYKDASKKIKSAQEKHGGHPHVFCYMVLMLTAAGVKLKCRCRGKQLCGSNIYTSATSHLGSNGCDGAAGKAPGKRGLPRRRWSEAAALRSGGDAAGGGANVAPSFSCPYTKL